MSKVMEDNPAQRHPIKHCLTLDLKGSPELIAEYECYHQPDQIWPQVTQSLREAGIINMEIYRLDTRLFMIMTVTETFSFESKAKADRNNPYVQDWENVMSKFQQPLAGSTSDEKWQLMRSIFNLSDCPSS